MTHTELEYVQDGSTGPEGTSFAAIGRGEQMPAGHGVGAQYRGDGVSMHQGYAQCAYAGASESKKRAGYGGFVLWANNRAMSSIAEF